MGHKVSPYTKRYHLNWIKISTHKMIFLENDAKKSIVILYDIRPMAIIFFTFVQDR
jgi:hypothetical protein